MVRYLLAGVQAGISLPILIPVLTTNPAHHIVLNFITIFSKERRSR
jgi:hypothetical protein